MADAGKATTEPSITTTQDSLSVRRVRPAFLVPVAVFVVLGIVLGCGLTRVPRTIPPALIGKRVPEFDLPPVKGRTLGLSSRDLKGEVSLVNVFSS